MGLVKARGRGPSVRSDTRAPVTGLNASDARERRRAVIAAAIHPDSAAAFCGLFGLEEDHHVREAILSGLMANPSSAVVEGLLPYLRCDDTDLRNGVIEALRVMPDAVAPYLDALLEDPDSDVRIAAVAILASTPRPQATRRLVEVLERDEHVNVCATAVEALAEIGGPEAVEPLGRVAARFPNDPFLAFIADAASRVIGRR